MATPPRHVEELAIAVYCVSLKSRFTAPLDTLCCISDITYLVSSGWSCESLAQTLLSASMPTRRNQPNPQSLPGRKDPAKVKTDDEDISDTESYFSSQCEPEYLTRLSHAVANGARRRNRPFRHHIRPIKHGEHVSDGPTSPATTISTVCSRSGETGFRYLVSDDIDTLEDSLERTDHARDRPTAQAPRRQRSNSGAADALPQIRAPRVEFPESQNVDHDESDFDSDDDDDSIKSLEAGFSSPYQRHRAQYDGQRCMSPSRRLRGFALQPSKSTVNISSPALANRLGVPLSAELEVWV